MPRIYNPNLPKSAVRIQLQPQNSIAVQKVDVQQPALKKRIVEGMIESSFIQSLKISQSQATPLATYTVSTGSERDNHPNLGSEQKAADKRELDIEVKEPDSMRDDEFITTNLGSTETGTYQANNFSDYRSIENVSEFEQRPETNSLPIGIVSRDPHEYALPANPPQEVNITEIHETLPDRKPTSGSEMPSRTTNMTEALNSYLKGKARRKSDFKWEDFDLIEHDLSTSKLCEEIAFVVNHASKFPSEVIRSIFSREVQYYELVRQTSPVINWNINMLKRIWKSVDTSLRLASHMQDKEKIHRCQASLRCCTFLIAVVEILNATMDMGVIAAYIALEQIEKSKLAIMLKSSPVCRTLWASLSKLIKMSYSKFLMDPSLDTSISAKIDFVCKSINQECKNEVDEHPRFYRSSIQKIVFVLGKVSYELTKHAKSKDTVMTTKNNKNKNGAQFQFLSVPNDDNHRTLLDILEGENGPFLVEYDNLSLLDESWRVVSHIIFLECTDNQLYKIPQSLLDKILGKQISGHRVKPSWLHSEFDIGMSGVNPRLPAVQNHAIVVTNRVYNDFYNLVETLDRFGLRCIERESIEESFDLIVNENHAAIIYELPFHSDSEFFGGKLPVQLLSRLRACSRMFDSCHVFILRKSIMTRSAMISEVHVLDVMTSQFSLFPQFLVNFTLTDSVDQLIQCLLSSIQTTLSTIPSSKFRLNFMTDSSSLLEEAFSTLGILNPAQAFHLSVYVYEILRSMEIPEQLKRLWKTTPLSGVLLTNWAT